MSENARLNAANNAETVLAQAITDTDTSFDVDDASSFPDTPFRVTITDPLTEGGIEIVEVDTVSGDTFSDVSRGMEDTTAISHDSGDQVDVRITAGVYDELIGEEVFDSHGNEAHSATFATESYVDDNFLASDGSTQLTATWDVGDQEIRNVSSIGIGGVPNDDIEIDTSSPGMTWLGDDAGFGFNLDGLTMSFERLEVSGDFGADLMSFDLDNTEISMESNPVRDVADPENGQDAATKSYVDNSKGEPVAFETGHTEWATDLSDEEVHRFANPNGFNVDNIEFQVKGGGTADAELRVQDGSTTINDTANTTTEENDVYTLDFSENGSYLVVSGQEYNSDGTVVYDTSDWSEETSFDDTGAATAKFSSDGQYLALAAYTLSVGGVVIRNVSDWSTETVLDESEDPGTWGLAFSHDGNWLAYGADSEVRVVDTSDWSSVTTLTDTTNTVRAVAFDKDDDYLAVGDQDGSLIVYDTSDWSEETSLTEESSDARCADFSYDGQYLAYGGSDDEVYVHNTSDWSLETTLTESGGTVQDVKFGDNDHVLAYGGYDDSVHIHNVGDWGVQESYTGLSGTAYSLSFSDDEELFAYGGGPDVAVRNTDIQLEVSADAGESDSTGYTVTDDPVTVKLSTNEQVNGSLILRGELE